MVGIKAMNHHLPRNAVKSNRRDLAAYVGRLRAFIVLTQARLIKKGILPV